MNRAKSLLGGSGEAKYKYGLHTNRLGNVFTI